MVTQDKVTNCLQPRQHFGVERTPISRFEVTSLIPLVIRSGVPRDIELSSQSRDEFTNIKMVARPYARGLGGRDDFVVFLQNKVQCFGCWMKINEERGVTV